MFILYLFFKQKKKERQRLAEKKKRKELNDLKSGQYQIVNNIL